MKKLLVLLLLPIGANAAPGAVTQQLMNEPASLFDIGMLRLNLLAEDFGHRVGLSWTNGESRKMVQPARVSARYDPDDDMIYVGIMLMDSEPNEQQMAEWCREGIRQMGYWLNKELPRIFMHTDYDFTEPDDIRSPLVDMFEIRCYVTSSISTAEGRFWAYRKLSTPHDEDMTIGRWKLRN